MQQQQLVKEMRPALIVGLGGTGQEVLVRIKARFLETFGMDALSVIKLAALDTRDEKLETKLDNGQTVSLNKNTELLDIGNVPTIQVLQHLDTNYRQVKAWLPDNIPSQSIVAGARQIRPLGRLALFFHYAKIRNYLDNLIQNLANINKQFTASSVRAEDEPGLQIFLVSSICGGTGSGTFLDTAYLLRHLCMRLNQPKIDLTGILVLPQAFTQVPSDQIKANAYAALLELDQFSSGTFGDNFDVEYPGEERIANPIRPFNICYLVDGLNEEGRVLAGLAELAPMIAESIFLQIGSQIGRRAGSTFDNLRTINDPNPHTDDQGVPHLNIYSGFGMSNLHFPARRLIDVCGRRFAYRLITQGILANQPTQERLQTEVVGFLDRLQLREDQLIDVIRRDENGNLMTLQPERQGLSVQSLSTVPDTQWPPQIQSRAQTFETRILGDTIRKRIEQNTKSLQQSLGQQLTQDMARLVDDPLGGLPLINPFVEAIRQNLNDTITQMTDRRRARQDELNDIDITTATRQLQNALQTWLDLGKSKRKTALTSLLNAYMLQFTLRYDIMCLDSAIQILSVLINKLDEQRREFTTLIDHLNYAADRFNRDDEEKTRRWDTAQDALDQVISDSNDLEVMYQRYVTDVNQQLTNLTSDEEAGPIHTWRTQYPTSEQVSARLLDFAMKVFTPINRIRLEDEILRKREEVAPGVRLEKLRTTSKPFWSIQIARVPDGGANIEAITMIAVEDQETSIYKDELLLRGTVGTTTLDPHRITVLQTKHGVPMSALAQIDDYRRIYDQYTRRQSVPLHVFPKPDIQHARTMFALGEAFGFIVEEGVANYVLKLPDDGVEETLGKGLTAAAQRFVSKMDYSVRMEQTIEKHIIAITKAKAADQITTYTQTEPSEAPERRKLELELHKLAREYKQQYL